MIVLEKTLGFFFFFFFFLGGGGAGLLGFLNYRRMFWVRGVLRLNIVLEFRVWSFFLMVLLVLVILRLGLVLSFVWLLRKCVKGKRSCFFLPPLSQCLMLAQITLGEQKCSKLGEIRRVWGFFLEALGRQFFWSCSLEASPSCDH